MSEEEIIEECNKLFVTMANVHIDGKAMANLLDLYNKQKEKNKLLQDGYDKRVFEIIDLESKIEELQAENETLKIQNAYLTNTNNKDILRLWRKK